MTRLFFLLSLSSSFLISSVLPSLLDVQGDDGWGSYGKDLCFSTPGNSSIATTDRLGEIDLSNAALDAPDDDLKEKKMHFNASLKAKRDLAYNGVFIFGELIEFGELIGNDSRQVMNSFESGRHFLLRNKLRINKSREIKLRAEMRELKDLSVSIHKLKNQFNLLKEKITPFLEASSIDVKNYEKLIATLRFKLSAVKAQHKKDDILDKVRNLIAPQTEEEAEDCIETSIVSIDEANERLRIWKQQWDAKQAEQRIIEMEV